MHGQGADNAQAGKPNPIAWGSSCVDVGTQVNVTQRLNVLLRHATVHLVSGWLGRSPPSQMEVAGPQCRASCTKLGTHALVGNSSVNLRPFPKKPSGYDADGRGRQKLGVCCWTPFLP